MAESAVGLEKALSGASASFGRGRVRPREGVSVGGSARTTRGSAALSSATCPPRRSDRIGSEKGCIGHVSGSIAGLLGECMVRSEHRLEVAGALPFVAVGAPRLAAEAPFGGCRHAKHVSLAMRAPRSRGARQTCFPHATTVHRSEVFYGCCERTSHCVGLLATLRPPQPRWRKQILGKRCQGVSAAPARSLGWWWPPSLYM